MKKKISNIILFCFLCLIFGCFNASAEEKNADTLTITCENNGIFLSNMEWKIYKVADILPNKEFSISGHFKNYPVKLNNLSTSELQAAAVTLETYAKIDEITPNNIKKTDSDGKVIFDNLDFGLYLISGKSVIIDDMFYMPAPSLIVLDNSEDEGVSWRYDVNALPKLKVLPASLRVYDFKCSVKKIWTDDNENNRPDSITVLLMKDGEEIDSAELNSNNNWTHEWNYLSSEFEWSVIEKDVPENYTVTYTQSDVNIKDEIEHDIEFTINNTYTQVKTSNVTSVSTSITSSVSTVLSKASALPQTGQLWWPVPVMSAGGLLIFCTGWKINSYKRRKK